MAIISIILIPSTNHDAGGILQTAALIYIQTVNAKVIHVFISGFTCLTMGYREDEIFERRGSKRGGGGGGGEMGEKKESGRGV